MDFTLGVRLPSSLTSSFSSRLLLGSRISPFSAMINRILSTAYSGFLAAKMDSSENEDPVIIHTGHWGCCFFVTPTPSHSRCGAYGGNKTLMAILQVIAARAAGIRHVVYHCFSGTQEAEVILPPPLSLLLAIIPFLPSFSLPLLPSPFSQLSRRRKRY